MTMPMPFRSLVSGFVQSAERFPSRPALVVDGESLTYLGLSRMAGMIASTILQHEQEPHPLVAVLAYRSKIAYTGILGILAAGRGYVPLNPKFPIERTRRMLALSGCATLVVGNESLPQLPKLLSQVNRRLILILPDIADVSTLSRDFPQHRFIGSKATPESGSTPFQLEVSPTATAYLLFTSGSTGEPKGVPVSQSNVRSYIGYVCDRYDVNEQDRFSQEFDLTFDLSVHDMFVCWERGACLFCVPEKAVMAPTKFIRDHQLTMWFSVPFVIGVLEKMRLLPPGCFPSLRYSLFCGEPLSATCAQQWQEAAANSTVENLYGPTETTIAITHYRWDKNESSKACLNGIVPLGFPFKGQRAVTIDQDGRLVSAGNRGELCLSGSQVTSGYWNNPPKTAEQFVRLPGVGETVWYRTGDLAKRDADGCLYYLGRLDRQVKIRGHRVELQEIEAVLRKTCGTDHVVSVAWPFNNGSAEGVVAFVSGIRSLDENSVLACCRKVLPEYMIPRRIHLLGEFPLNSNGKIDRHRLISLLEATKE
jgi:amino acid adenylation domain-containing protein